MQPYMDVSDFVAGFSRAFGPDPHELLFEASGAGLFVDGVLEAEEDGWVAVDVGDAGSHCRYRVRLRTEPAPCIDCGCRSSRYDRERCTHMAWLLLRGGELDETVTDFDAFWDNSIRATRANLMRHAACTAVRTIARPTHDDVRPEDPADDCPICYNPFGEHACVRCTACPAHFHRGCAARWGSSCPMCRDPYQFTGLRDPSAAAIVPEWGTGEPGFGLGDLEYLRAIRESREARSSEARFNVRFW